MKLNGTRQIPVYSDDINTMGSYIRTIKKSTEMFWVASREIGLVVNVRKLCAYLSCEQNTGEKIQNKGRQ